MLAVFLNKITQRKSCENIIPLICNASSSLSPLLCSLRNKDFSIQKYEFIIGKDFLDLCELIWMPSIFKDAGAGISKNSEPQ